jgi:hypothetical protein
MPEFSENGNFVIEAGVLYMRASHAGTVLNHYVDHATTHSFAPALGSPDAYHRLVSLSHYFRDCLCTAEDLITGAYPSSAADLSAIRSRVVGTHADFGDTNASYIAAARDAGARTPDNVNSNASPGLGEAFVIVSRYSTSAYPYHAAAVIAVDGNSRVTLEVFASGEDAATRTEHGDYHIYSVVAGSGSTFHETWRSAPALRSTSGITPPTTIVIEPRR